MALDGVKDGVINDPRQCKFDVASLLCKAGDSRGPVPHALAGQGDEGDVCRADRRAHRQADLCALPAGQRGLDGQADRPLSGLERLLGQPAQAGRAAAHRFDPALGLRRSQVELVDLRLGQGHRHGARQAVADDRRHRSRPRRLPQAWRQADPVHGLGRSGGRCVRHHRLLRPARDTGRLCATLHGAGHGPLRPRPRRHQLLDRDAQFGAAGQRRPARHGRGAARLGREGQAPHEIVATHFDGPQASEGKGKIVFQRPLCPWPEVARYQGGPTDKAESFTCGN